jgi:hypothetical protein
MDSTNVEKVVIDWLETLLGDALPVFGDKPKNIPDQGFVLVDRTGGPREAMVLDQAEILIEVYHKTSRVTASDHAQMIADNIPSLHEIESITRAKVNSLVKLDDTISQLYRYQLYCDIFCRR